MKILEGKKRFIAIKILSDKYSRYALKKMKVCITDLKLRICHIAEAAC